MRRTGSRRKQRRGRPEGCSVVQRRRKLRRGQHDGCGGQRKKQRQQQKKAPRSVNCTPFVRQVW